ncbi:glycine betaine ABC transporter substrate-binding protein [Streptomyces alkaliterrae]|uniref:Glycine/betaine ABC transporter substrate-binding protein n=1 Tax=Streptomyces alkaliterrae TaxID=2213162 RepID=A0A5P0YNA6_9ACTN|nr:glycine betaine ABC transporter substrate-binding protein [Streptomyces alkaliterrae]MBB1254116.1 glycine/betaine ABC transporter substrate-binding protein [Streptomyces alkaliterrae]MBB1260196.1 glycine/betaine ABC transporter substrate-binding protein [Streptomyces alkaliterrae]MQS01715.1 glycine/betaine ABC transporter substrate-binding protein [Streptomyces alkaliterrae]
MFGIGNSPRSRSRRAVVAGTGAFLLAVLAGCGSQSGGEGSGGEVTLVAPTWVGGQANVAVAAYLLEKELGYQVKIEEMDEAEGWKAVGEGRADAILEDWDLPDQYQEWVMKKKTVVPAGRLGVTGRIGWFVPRYLADRNRDVLSWEKLNNHVELFGGGGDGKGVLLQGDPSYKSNDEAIIKNLGLDYELKYLGTEGKQLSHIRKAAKDRKPFLTYWWTPHWVEEEVELAEVKLPAYYAGCDEEPDKTRCGYPETDLRKYLNKEFSEDGGKAAKFLKNFEWGAEDQNEVARLIAGEGMDPKEAAAKWVGENEGLWHRWLWDLDN